MESKELEVLVDITVNVRRKNNLFSKLLGFMRDKAENGITHIKLSKTHYSESEQKEIREYFSNKGFEVFNQNSDYFELSWLSAVVQKESDE